MERPSPDRFIHFGSVGQKMRRRDPEVYEATETLPSTIPTYISRINPLVAMPSIREKQSTSQDEELSNSNSNSKFQVPSIPKAHYFFKSQISHDDSGVGTTSSKQQQQQQQQDKETTIKDRKVKVSSFPKDHSWFRSQTDRDDTVMETRAETIYDNRSELSKADGSNSINSVFCMQEDDASYS